MKLSHLGILALIFLFFACTNANTKQMQLANKAIEKAKVSKELNQDLPLGFSFSMTKEEVENDIKKLITTGYITKWEGDSFCYKFSKDCILSANIELFFVDNILSRFVIQFSNSRFCLREWEVEYRKIIDKSGYPSYTYLIPNEQLKDLANLDKIEVRVNKNKVLTVKTLKYTGLESKEVVYVFENMLKSKLLAEYKTKKEIYAASNRVRNLVKSEKWCEENRELLDKSIKDYEDKKVLVKNSAIDDSVFQVVEYLKKNLNDPDSYQSIVWGRVNKEGNNYTVTHKYRAKNGFGGYVIELKHFVLNKNGIVISCK
ncbi:MAG: hypothetical protein WBG43_00195 [Marinifilaceae bacterium]